ncbi:MAG: ABC transporter ATP-binding protein [Geminicoccaceae bacterium]|nr:MAG: ABC transporter ATP-binding protein [Geminicoccaceae bacterium]
MTALARTAVSFANVSKLFGEVRAVDDVSFEVAEGELVTFLGPSGCGKTTTLRLVAGLELASAGRITIAGRDVTALSASERDVAMVFQSYALFPHMTVFENVAYGLQMSGVKKAEVTARAEAALATVGLPGYGARLPSELSGGQQQRVAVARAVVLEPRVLLFDEPLSNLDAKLRRKVREDIRELQQRLGLTAVYVTHDQEEALAISDRIVVMREGKIAQVGAPRDLYERPADRFVADFIGDANLVEAEVVALADGMAEVALGPLRCRLPATNTYAGPALLALRPEALVLHDALTPDRLAARVVRASYLGSHVAYVLATPAGELFAVDGNVDQLRPAGSELGLTLARHGVALVAG